MILWRVSRRLRLGPAFWDGAARGRSASEVAEGSRRRRLHPTLVQIAHAEVVERGRKVGQVSGLRVGRGSELEDGGVGS